MTGANWISIAVPIVLNLIALGYFAANLRTRIDQLERDVQEARDIPGRVIRLETQLAAIQIMLTRIENKLDAMVQHAAT